MRHLFLTAICIVHLVFSSATAQEISQYVTMTPASGWVDAIKRPVRNFALGGAREKNYLLVDKQYKYGKSDTQRYNHYVDELLTPNAVENNSTITVDFDPAYETVIFHQLHRTREGVETDIFDMSRFDLYRAETDRDKLIYNGTLQLSYLIPDVRVGDILDYSYTIRGKNPAIGAHFTGGFKHAYSVAVQHQSIRVLYPTETKLQIKSYGEAMSPKISQHGELTKYTWDSWDIAATMVDADMPPSVIAYPTTVFSTFETWGAVGAYFAPFYDVTHSSSDPLRKIAADIRAEHQTPQTRLRAALDFVQREIRYLGIELGQGGYIPRQPNQVLLNRFGDCKDMTLLLIAILAELDIKAVPFLVNLERTDAVDRYIPTHGAFDHVIVSAFLDDKTYYLDPTRGVQLGDLNHLQQGDFGKGLVIAKDGPGMIDAPVPTPNFWKNIIDTYDTVTEPGAILLTSVANYRMAQADSMLAWYRRKGAASADRSFLEFFQNDHPQIEQLAPLQLDINEAGGEVTITGKYRIPEAWQDDDAPNTMYFYAQASDILFDMPKFIGASRTTPFKFSYPLSTRQTLRFILDDTWGIENNQEVIDHPALKFSRVERFFNNIDTVVFSYQAKSNEISAGDFFETMAAIRKARNVSGVTLTIDNSIESSDFPTWLAGIKDRETIILFWTFFAVFLSLVGGLLSIRNDRARIAEQIYHPVSVTKFVILSVVSLGVYPVFWSFMNWRWARHVDNQDVSPGWRAFFMALTNFGLFDRMASRVGGFDTFRSINVLLAIIILTGEISNPYYRKVPDAPDWLFFFGGACMIAWIPAVMHVNMLNKAHPECLRENSKFGWPALGMLALFSPIFGLIVYAYL